MSLGMSHNFKFSPQFIDNPEGRMGTMSLLKGSAYFGIAQMPVVGSTYWNLVHGARAGEAAEDAEGLQTMRNLARNMAYYLKCQEAGRQAGVPLPEPERTSRTNFIR